MFFPAQFILCVIVTSRLFLLSSSSSICTKTTLSNCMAQMNNAQISDSVIPSHDKNTILEYCRTYNNFSGCYNTLKPYCTSTNVWDLVAVCDGIDKSYGYLCKDSMREYLGYQECFSDPDLQTDAQSCNDTLINQLKRISLENDPIVKMSKYCQYADTYLGCTNNFVKSNCGEDAANWLTTFDRKSLETILKSYKCKGWVSETSTETTSNSGNTDFSLVMILCISIGIFGILVVIILMCLIINKCKSIQCCCCFYQRNGENDHHHHLHHRLSVSSDLPPPPYPGSFVYYDENGCPIPVQPTIEGTGNHQGGGGAEAGGFTTPLNEPEKITLKLTIPGSCTQHVARSYSEPACLEVPISLSNSCHGRNSSITMESSHPGFSSNEGSISSSIICPSTPTTHFELPSNLPILSLLGDDQLGQDSSGETGPHQPPPCDYY